MKYTDRFRLSAALRDAIRRSALTQTTLGAAADLSQSQISLFLNGHRFAPSTVMKVERLAEIVGVDPSQAAVREAR